MIRKKRYILCVIAILLMGCSKETRLANLIKRNPELLVKDTITVTDTLITENIKTDTVLGIESLHDTVYITKDKLRIKTVRFKDSIFIEGECISDTVIKEIKVPFEKIVIKELTFWQKNKLWIISLLIGLAYMGLRKKIPLLP
jgi:hypothetical protein